ncbi:carbamate kinase [Alkalispirochaeta sphaeroplastigenens]|uniref:Carbamate kinase n=1 Tax=Alkalispirochaeta sphaeroplastigenens TaxID=1187066 RepID=A0A2S4JPF5_9SPIO|nr:carbamate kinase [Alkalispirochaeta sphaeroplastigenens]POR01353.1 carbamate kinase [Alkalispirochaeta sphaeroplastigenens]
MSHTQVDPHKLAVIALGGNAIIAKGQKGLVHEQFENVRRTVDPVVELIAQGYNFIVTHGNGPQVGNLLLQNELAREEVPEIPLAMLDAMTCGSMGYMIEQCLQNAMIRRGIWKNVVTIPAQVIVDRFDPAMEAPTKPIGPFYTEEQARKLIQEKGWLLKEDAGRGWRRFVASPYPIDIVEKEAIRQLLRQQYLLVTGGGGGIPVSYHEDGTIEGVDCVIDKDLASMKLAIAVHARTLIIITGVPKVTLNFGTPQERALDRITLAQARHYYQEGQFPPGSMGPKMMAAIEFVQADPENRVIITNEGSLLEAVAGREGTHIVAY